MHLGHTEALADLRLGELVDETHPQYVPVTVVEFGDERGEGVEVLHELHRGVLLADEAGQGGLAVVAVAVIDADPRPPRERAPDLTGKTGGSGRPMVQNPARSVTVNTGPSGKTVRAELPR